MSHGNSPTQPWVLDSVSELGDSFLSIDDDLELLNIDDSDLEDEQEVVTIKDDDTQAIAPQSPRKRPLKSNKLKNGPPELPWVETRTCQLVDGTLIKIDDTIELKDDEKYQPFELHSADFLRVRKVFLNLESDEVQLQGYRLRRTKYNGPSLPRKLNELVMILQANEEDTRSEFLQGMETVPIHDVLRKRVCIFTNKPYPMNSWRDSPLPDDFNFMTKAEREVSLFHTGRLVCRFVFIVYTTRTGRSYAGVVRAIYGRESDHLTPIVPRESHISGSEAFSGHIPLDIEDEDVIVISTQKFKETRGPRERSDYVKELGHLPMKHKGMPTKKLRLTFGDCFCGAGGASTGAVHAGLHVKWGLDQDHAALQAYCFNQASAVPILMNAHDFPSADFAKSTLKVDILHLSPPCCYWSPAHTRAGPNDQANYEAIFTVGPILKKLKPRVATLEQTYGLLQSREHNKIFNLLLGDIIEAGYNVRYKLQDMSEFGLPQRRKRLLVIAARRGIPLPPFPEPTHGPPGSGLKRFVSVYEALWPLRHLRPSVDNDDEYHQPGLMRSCSGAPYDPKTSMLKGCITTGGGNNYHYSGHRKNTVREMSLFQGFPYGYQFTGSQTEALKQIGNAFPPIMAEAMFRVIAQTLEAFDDGFIEAEEEFSDLLALLEGKGVELPEQPRGLRLSSFTTDSRVRAAQAPFRYLFKPTAASQPATPVKRRSLWARGNSIEGMKPEPEKAHKKTSFFDFTMEDVDDSDSTLEPDSDSTMDDDPPLPFPPDKPWTELTAYEREFWAEANGIMIDVD